MVSKTPDAYEPDTVAAKVQGAYATALEKASSAAGGATSAIEGNPLAALLAGIALGAAAGALLPRSDREKALLAPLGERLSDAARAAVAAGREAGSQALADADLSVDGLRDQVGALFGQAVSAAGAAGSAAFAAARQGATGKPD